MADDRLDVPQKPPGKFIVHRGLVAPMVSLAQIHLVTLGVRDIAASTRFYEALGWRRSSASTPDVTFLRSRGAVLALYGRNALAQDARTPPVATGFAAIALGSNVPAQGDVDRALTQAMRAGAKVVKPAEDTEWGGRSGYFRDPDGHLWEIAWNPHFPIKADGSLELPE